MRRRGNDHGVEVRGLQHLAVIGVRLARVLELGDHRIAARLPDIARGGHDDVRMFRAFVQVPPAHAAAADEAEVDSTVGGPRRGLGPADQRPGGEAKGGDRGGRLEEGAAGEWLGRFHKHSRVCGTSYRGRGAEGQKVLALSRV